METASIDYAVDTGEQIEMDEELKKVLKELTKSMTALTNHTVQASSTLPVVQTSASPKFTISQTVGLVVGIIAILGALLGTVKYIVHSELDEALKDPAVQIATLKTDSAYLRRDVDDLRLQHSASVFKDGQTASPTAIGKAADNLRENAVQLPRPEVAKAGRALVQAVSTTNDLGAWDAANRVLDYLSFLNAHFVPPQIEEGAPGFDVHYGLPTGWKGKLFWTGHSEGRDVPELRQSVEPDGNGAQFKGPAYVVAKGGEFRIDGMVMKRVIVEDARVIYSGGAVSMENVYFVNCTFSLERSPKALLFANSLLSDSVKTGFTVSS